MTGQIRKMAEDKDFAFLVSGKNRDIFLHKTDYHGNWDELRELYRAGTVQLEFEVENGAKGLRASKARLV